jgi:hypothetical protein
MTVAGSIPRFDSQRSVVHEEPFTPGIGSTVYTGTTTC